MMLKSYEKKIHDSVSPKRVEFADFFLKFSSVLCCSFSLRGPNAFEKRSIESAKTRLTDKPAIKFLSRRTAMQL